jgi:putative spermidine/putrescine transport system substrate-binding protein
MDYSLGADVQAEVEYWYGAAGSNTDSCAALEDLLGKKYADLANTLRYGFCGDAEFLNSLYLWKTPQVECGDDRGAVCTDYSVWQQKWTEIRGA